MALGLDHLQRPWKKPRNRSVHLDTKPPIASRREKKIHKSNHQKKLSTSFRRQSPLAVASLSQADRMFSYHVWVKLAKTTSAFLPATATPERTLAPPACPLVPFTPCSSPRAYGPSHPPRRSRVLS